MLIIYDYYDESDLLLGAALYERVYSDLACGILMVPKTKVDQWLDECVQDYLNLRKPKEN